MRDVLNIFLQIVQIDSESFYEENMSKFIQNFLQERDINFKVDKLNQIYAKISGELEPIIFCAHMDTVSPGKNIKPIVKSNGKITSSGDTILGADNKASVATILALVDKISKREIKNRHAVEICFTVQEEVSPSGASQLNFDFFDGKVCIIFDEGDSLINSVVTRAAYIDEFEVEFFGKSSHASLPKDGVNALLMANEFINNLKVGVPYKESTLNFGLIFGGTAINTIPNYIKVSGDFRSNFFETQEKIREDFKNAKEKVLQKFPNGDVKINDIIYCKGYEISKNSKNLVRLEKIYKSCGFESLVQIESQGGSDASSFMEHGIEGFCLGDGSFRNHSVEEWTTIENLEKLLEISEKIVIGF